MNDWPTLPLEDTFGDCLRKALRGNRTDAAALAQRTGIPAAEIEAWLADRGAANGEQARAIARELHLSEAKFAVRAADGWYPPLIDAPQVRRHSQHPHPSNGYVYDTGGGKAALVDPAGVPSHLLRVLREGNYDLEYILITHKHDDHCDAAQAIAAAYPVAKVVMHPLDWHAIGALASHAYAADDGGSVAFSDGTTIGMMHTPGHTDGSVCYQIGSVVFTGDMLFAGSVGGAYGYKSTYNDILHSIATKLFTLPEATAVMPGHGPATTIALERAHNPFFS